MYTTRILPPEEWEKVADVFTTHGGTLPHPPHAAIAVTEDAGQIVGLLTCQLVPHCEPLWIHPEHRGKVSWLRLLRVLEDVMPGETYYTFTTSAEQAQMAVIGGLLPRPWAVFQGSAPCRS